MPAETMRSVDRGPSNEACISMRHICRDEPLNEACRSIEIQTQRAPTRPANHVEGMCRGEPSNEACEPMKDICRGEPTNEDCRDNEIHGPRTL